jgi:hypothetical protein
VEEVDPTARSRVIDPKILNESCSEVERSTQRKQKKKDFEKIQRANEMARAEFADSKMIFVNLVNKTEAKFEKFPRREKISVEIFEKFDHDRKKSRKMKSCCEQKLGRE